MGSNLALSMFLYGVLAPALSGAVLSAVARKTATLQSLLMAGAAVCSLLLVYGDQFHWPPAQGLDWLILVPAALSVPMFLPLPVAARWVATGILLLAATHFMLQPALAVLPAPWLWALLIAALWTGFLLPLRTGQEKAGATGALTGCSAALALIVGMSGSALVAQLFGALAATLAGIGLVSLFTRQPADTWPFRAAIFGLAMVALFYAQIHYLLFILPLMAGIFGAPVARRMLTSAASRFKTELLSFIIALLVAVPVLLYVIQQKLSQPGGYY